MRFKPPRAKEEMASRSEIWKPPLLFFDLRPTAFHGGYSSNNGDSDVGCILPFFEVITADLTGPAVTWDTCSNSLRQIEPSSKVHRPQA